MWDVRACRSCLATKGKLEKLGETYRRVYTVITGLTIKNADGYPTYFCVECKMQIKKALAFRRKSRRAYFVMQEIMNVKKQVTFTDIVGVNRKRTNLDAILGFSKPNNNVCYMINRPESTEDDTQTEGVNVLTKYRPVQIFNVYHTVDIKPSMEEIQLEIQSLQSDLVVFSDEVNNTVDNTDNTADNACETSEVDDTKDIDLNDVFKDLIVKTEDEEDVPVAPPVKKKRKRGKLKEPKPPKVPIIKTTEVANALANTEIRVLSIDEQKQMFANRMLSATFKNAIYKCGLCLYVYNSMNELLEHVNFHNKSVNGHFLCIICKTKTLTEDLLINHIAEQHLYEYTCQSCHVKEYTLSDIVKHMKKYHKIKTNPRLVSKYSLEGLKESYEVVNQSPDEMKLFMKTFTALKEWQKKCDSCNIGFKFASTYERHMRRHEVPENPTVESQCDVCGLWFKSKEKIQRHMDLWHRYKYICKFCDTVCYNQTQANHHKLIHKVRKRTDNMTCNICLRQFKSEAGVVFHKYSQHYNDVYAHHCNVCGHSYSTPALLYHHQLSQHKRISISDPFMESQYECTICDVKFLSEKALNIHIVRQNHDEAKNFEYTCTPCKKLFDTEVEYRTHLITCKYGSRFPKKCCYCDEIIENSMGYTNHFAKEHPSLEYMPVRDVTLCELCGKPFRSYKLARHMKSHAEAELGLTCRFCHVKIITRKQYITHILANHTHKPYHCMFCNVKCKYRSECKDHILKLHAPVRPYKCQYCDREFSHMEFLNLHSKKIHNFDVKKNLKKRPSKMKGKIFVYPHMKINMSLIEKEILNQVEIEICDYLDKNNTPLVNRSDHLIIDMPEPVETDVKEKKRKRTLNTDQNSGIKKKKTDSGIKKKKKEEDEIEKALAEMHKEESDDIKEDVDNAEDEMETIKYEDISDVTEFENETLEVIEQDGQQFVMINNVLYRIEKE